jgi:phosphohistidine swiveling domain-containing protein
MDYVRPLDQFSAGDWAVAGGKGANLGELRRAGFPVPPGFVLTVDAYRAFVEANGLQEVITVALQDTDLEDPAVLERAATTIADRFAGGEIPSPIAAGVCRSYAALGGGPVAVRSSATVEDLPEASFAGQQETFLDVIGNGAVLEAVKRCWASLWTGRALAYRQRRAIPADDVALAVVVQPMIAAEVAGALFTANPTSGDPDEMVIDAAPGFGDAVVAGEITPEEIVVDRRTGTLRRHSGPSGRVLSEPQMVELAGLGERIEAHFGRPQDVEWAWADGRFRILQARPITTPLRPRLTWEPPQPGVRYMRGGVMELMPEPVSVLFETLGLRALEHATKEQQRRLGMGTGMQNWGFATINGYVYGWVKASPRMLLDLFLALPKLLGRVRLATTTPELWERETLPAYRQGVAALHGDPGELSTSELLDWIEALTSALANFWAVFAAMVPHLDRAERRFVSLYRRLRRRRDPEPAVLLRGLENRPLEAERALYEGREGDLEPYIAAYGHALYNLDFAVPLAGENQAALEAMRRAWSKGVPSPDERHRQLAMEREAVTQTIRGRLPGWLRRLLDRSLAAAQEAARVREDALFDLGLAWEPLRCYALELGRRLAGAGVLPEAEQVFWLRHDELRTCVQKLERGSAAPSRADEAESRRREREAARGARIPFTIPERKVFGLMRRLLPTAGAQWQVGGEVLTGRGTSPGRVKAMARVIHRSEEFERLGCGEILVAHATTPAWTPLFALAGGVVTDLGGALSHGSIVAREYGIPAVMGTGNATERIRDGQVITVDGTEGRVYLAGRRWGVDPREGRDFYGF